MLSVHCRSLIGAILAAVFAGVAAAPVDDFQTWTNVAVGGALYDSWRYAFDASVRFGEDSSRYTYGLVRPGIGYSLNEHTSLWAGYAHSNTAGAAGAKAVDEHRLWQQILWTQPTVLGTFTARTRLEQRRLDSGDDTGWRLRQMQRLVHPFARTPRASLVLANEFFFHLNDTDWSARTGLDQHRAFVGLGCDLAARLHGEVGYLNIYQHRAGRADRLTHVLSLNLSMRF